MAGIVGLALVTLVKGTVLDHSTSVTLVGRLGVVATTVFAVATLFCIYRTFVSASWVAAVLATVLYGPAAVWAWLVFVEGSVPSTHFTTAGFIVSAAISVVLLSRGLSEARWAEVFGGLAAADLVFSVMPFRGDEPQESLVFVALLVALAGATGLYGLLVDVELSAYESLDEIQQSNEVLVRENKRNNELLHDLRSGLLSIEAAALSSGSGLSAPVSSEAARLRRLTAVHRDGPPSFDLVPGVRDLVASKEAAGAVLALSVPSRVEVTGDESEVLAIVENLIANAQRHGRSPVEIQVECANGTVELSVADSGGGIDESVRDRVFERGVTTDPEGAGLGLARARELAERNNGRLVLDAGSSSKTRFVLALETSVAMQE
ncbi:MAG: HAMP domain-containing histidine kinase [Actinomycetia bacterium]|nr:HAMP domain-containing histidine kinase [Actinomycetes bacterium]MCP4224472.1 HAMP domain-containing histidine kinase [Actinomycetes bacterium]